MTDHQQPKEPLSLDSQPKRELKALADVETESWRALTTEHQRVIMQLRSTGGSWRQQITALKEQLVDIQCLHRANQQKRASLQQRQAMDIKGQSSGHLDASN